MLTGVLCGVLAGALWGMVFIVPELLPGFSPVELAVGRYMAYGAISLALLLPRLARLLRRLVPRDYLALLRQALSGNLVYYMLLALGVKLAGVAPTSLIIGLIPVAVTLLGRRDHGAVPLRRMALPLLVVAVAIGCINVDALAHAQASGAGGASVLLGLACAAGALLCWTWYAVDNARYLKGNPQFSGGEWSSLYGLASGLVALPIGLLSMLFTQGAEAVPAVERDWTQFWIYNGLLALGASVIGNGLWNIASRRLPVTLTGQLILFETVAAMLYGFVYRGTPPRLLEIVAIGLLVAGVTWSVRLHAAVAPERVVVA
ncbi:MAG: EamA/RhaT family transporter [Massilia sp.]|nr:EamA/RhaT family transporter [Massilia sp.]MDB5793016.1 EamA/RhaT family transporter [Massilia sp.]